MMTFWVWSVSVRYVHQITYVVGAGNVASKGLDEYVTEIFVDLLFEGLGREPGSPALRATLGLALINHFGKGEAGG